MSTFNKVLIGLLGLQVALAAALWLRPSEPSIGRPKPLLEDFDAAMVEELRVLAPREDGEEGDEPDLALARHNGSWVLRSHHDYPADQSRVDEVLRKLGAMQTRGAMTTSPARHGQLRVADDEYERKLKLILGEEKRTLYLGSPAGSRRVAVRLAGEDDVYAVTGISAAAVGPDPGEWIVSEVFSVPEDQVKMLTLRRDGDEEDIVLERDGELGSGWALIGGPSSPKEPAALDQDAIQSMMRSVVRIRAAAPADPRADMTSPLASITLTMSAREEAEEGAPIEAGEHVIVVAGGTNDRYLVRAGDTGRPVFVGKWSLRRLIELEIDELIDESDET